MSSCLIPPYVIGAQHSYRNRKYGRPVKINVLTFEEWFEDQLAHFDEVGAVVRIIEECIFIKYPGQKFNGFTIGDFRDEYKYEYLKQKRPSISEGVEA